MEELFYRAKPFLCMGLGVMTFTIGGAPLIGQISALILINCGALIFYRRKSAHSATTRLDKKPTRAKRLGK